MERYDGKTRKDDYIKYGMIALAAVLVCAVIFGLNHYLRKKYHTVPDYQVVLVSEEAFDEERTAKLETMLGALVGDRNGDGRTTVSAEVLRITDEAAAQKLDSDANEAYLLAVEAAGGDFDAAEIPTARFSALNVDADSGRMMVDLSSGEVWLFLLSNQPLGDFPGVAASYGGQEFFLELPEDMQDGSHADRTVLTGTRFMTELGLRDIPFYGFVLDGGDGAEESFAVEVLRKIKEYQ